MEIKKYIAFFSLIFIVHTAQNRPASPTHTQDFLQTKNPDKKFSCDNLIKKFCDQFSDKLAPNTARNNYPQLLTNETNIQKRLEQAERERNHWKALAIALSIKSSITFACTAVSALYYYLYHIA